MILIFDPGPSTGVAVLSMRGEPLYTTTLLSIEEVKERAEILKDKWEPWHVVIEEGPERGQYRLFTQQIEEHLRSVFPDAVWIRPGEWKGHPAANADGLIGHHTKHEKDTVSLGRYYLKVVM